MNTAQQAARVPLAELRKRAAGTDPVVRRVLDRAERGVLTVAAFNSSI